MNSQRVREIFRKGIASLAALSIALPAPAFALRQAGLEESAAKTEFLDRLDVDQGARPALVGPASAGLEELPELKTLLKKNGVRINVRDQQWIALLREQKLSGEAVRRHLGKAIPGGRRGGETIRAVIASVEEARRRAEPKRRRQETAGWARDALVPALVALAGSGDLSDTSTLGAVPLPEGMDAAGFLAALSGTGPGGPQDVELDPDVMASLGENAEFVVLVGRLNRWLDPADIVLYFAEGLSDEYMPNLVRVGRVLERVGPVELAGRPTTALLIGAFAPEEGDWLQGFTDAAGLVGAVVDGYMGIAGEPWVPLFLETTPALTRHYTEMGFTAAMGRMQVENYRRRRERYRDQAAYARAHARAALRQELRHRLDRLRTIEAMRQNRGSGEEPVAGFYPTFVRTQMSGDGALRRLWEGTLAGSGDRALLSRACFEISGYLTEAVLAEDPTMALERWVYGLTAAIGRTQGVWIPEMAKSLSGRFVDHELAGVLSMELILRELGRPSIGLNYNNWTVQDVAALAETIFDVILTEPREEILRAMRTVFGKNFLHPVDEVGPATAGLEEADRDIVRRIDALLGFTRVARMGWSRLRDERGADGVLTRDLMGILRGTFQETDFQSRIQGLRLTWDHLVYLYWGEETPEPEAALSAEQEFLVGSMNVLMSLLQDRHRSGAEADPDVIAPEIAQSFFGSAAPGPIADGLRINPERDLPDAEELVNSVVYLVDRAVGLVYGSAAGLEERVPLASAPLPAGTVLHAQKGLLEPALLNSLREQGVWVNEFLLGDLRKIKAGEGEIFVASVPHGSALEERMLQPGVVVINLYGSVPDGRPQTPAALATLVERARASDNLLRLRGMTVDDVLGIVLLDRAA